MFLKPRRSPDHLDRLTLLKETYNLTMEPEVTSMFYFDLALKSFLAIRLNKISISFENNKKNDLFSLRDMMQSEAWPTSLQYITCEEFDGTNTPNRTINLKASLMAVTEPTAYGDFVWPSTPDLFNGYSYMKFDMDVKANNIVKGVTSASRALGTWSAGLNSTMSITDPKTMVSLTAAIIYRVYTVLVCIANQFILVK